MIAKALKLSPKIKGGSSSGYPSSEYKLRSHIALGATSKRQTYSASVDDKDTIFCYFDPHVIAPPAKINTYPDTEDRS